MKDTEKELKIKTVYPWETKLIEGIKEIEKEIEKTDKRIKELEEESA